MRNILPLAEAMDSEEALEFRPHALPDDMDAEGAVLALRALFDADCKFAVAPDGKRVVARVRPHQHDEVSKAIDAMK